MVLVCWAAGAADLEVPSSLASVLSWVDDAPLISNAGAAELVSEDEEGAMVEKGFVLDTGPAGLSCFGVSL